MSTRRSEQTRPWLRGDGIDAGAVRRPLSDLPLPNRLLRPLAELDVTTVADALAVPRSAVLARNGVGKRSWYSLRDCVVAWLLDHGGQPLATDEIDLDSEPAAPAWLVDDDLRRALVRLDLLHEPPLSAYDIASRRELLLALPGMRAELLPHLLPSAADEDLADASAGDHRDGADRDPIHQLLGSLPAAVAETLRWRVMQPRAGAAALGTADALLRHDPIREALTDLRAARPAQLRHIEQAAKHMLELGDGVIHAHHLPVSSPLRWVGGSEPERTFPLRLLAALHGDRLCWDDGTLLACSLIERTRAAVLLDEVTKPAALPMAVSKLQSKLAHCTGHALPQGIVMHLVAQSRRVQVVFDPTHGEVVQVYRVRREDRLERLLRASGKPMRISDLLFAHRERFGCSRRSALLDTLHEQPRFVRVGRDRWDLRERHLDMIELLEPEAARLRDLIQADGRRRELVEFVDPTLTSELTIWLLRDLMCRDPGLRSLGRGVFRPAKMRESTQMQELRAALRRAGGELPLRRFLTNQNPRVRLLRERLLQRNRAFLEVREDRIDVLDNYPFTPDRLGQLLRAVELHLEGRDGWDRLEAIEAVVEETGLVGPFLTRHMLRDLLRRHGDFDLVPDDLVVQRSRPVVANIALRAREVIRYAGRPLTPSEIVAESPDLAPFAAAIEHVLSTDPITYSEDGLHWALT